MPNPIYPVDAEAPSLAEIIELTRSELTIKQDDEIRDCGRPALAILQKRPDACRKIAYEKLHEVPYKDVKTCWRRLYTDAALWEVLKTLENRLENGDAEVDYREDDDWLTQVVTRLDMALILTGAPLRADLVEIIFSLLQAMIARQHSKQHGMPRSSKRRKLLAPDNIPRESHHIPETFPSMMMTTTLNLRFPLQRVSDLSLGAFEKRISNSRTQAPLIIEGAIDHWPALSERPWSKPSYLLSHTLDGRRLVPIEVGKSYTDQEWGQKILSFGDFMSQYMFGTLDDTSKTLRRASVHSEGDIDGISETKAPPTGYLAQHDLLAQFPSLRADISVPDYCYAEPPPLDSNLSKVKEVPKLEIPLLNAWFGPAGTISPLHTDPYHNILAQVVGSKYVRLYAPSQTERLHPRATDENGIDMSNTSEVDLDEAMSRFPELSPWDRKGKGEDGQDRPVDEEARTKFEATFPGFGNAAYVEGVLGPGDCLYIPVGWWHYIKSLTPSFSVSFWFN